MRTKIVQKPLLYRQKHCLVTGRADGDIVDFGVDAKVNAAPHVYIKLSEVEAAAKLGGMIDKSEVAKLEQEREESAVVIRELRTALQMTNITSKADAAAMAYAGAAAASAVIAQNYPDIELPNAEIIAAAEELVEPTKDEIVNHQEA